MNLMQGRHGGDVFKLPSEERESFLDFSININPLGLSPKGKHALINGWERETLRYPDLKYRELQTALSDHYKIPMDMISVGNGASELMYAILRALRPGTVYLPAPSFSEYRLSAMAVGAKIKEFLLLKEENTFHIPLEVFEHLEPGSVIYLGNPNNPDGQLLKRKDFSAILAAAEDSGSYVIIDESFIDFLGDEFSYRNECNGHKNLIIVTSLTKFYAVPGLRIGCSFASKGITGKVQTQLVPWNVNGIAQLYMCHALEDNDYIQRSRFYCSEERKRMAGLLSSISGISVFDGTVNFILCKLTGCISTAASLQDKLYPFRILIRQCGNYSGLDDTFFRIAVRTVEEDNTFVAALKEVFKT